MGGGETVDFKEDVGVNFVIWSHCFPYTQVAKCLVRVVAPEVRLILGLVSHYRPIILTLTLTLRIRT